jgi:REP element-mobilizing transposase RayT
MIKNKPPREGEAPAEPKPGTDPRLRGSVALPSDSAIEKPKRRNPTHGIKHVDGQPTIVFDTLCLKRRVPILACNAFHHIFRDVAEQATAWLTGRYVIMPDHIHFFAADIDANVPYENWVRYLKSQITKRFAPGRQHEDGRDDVGGRGSRRAATPGAPPTPQERCPPDFQWLTDHWDTRMRNASSYEEKWNYIRDNPVRKGLVASADDWPYQGEVFELRWA